MPGFLILFCARSISTIKPYFDDKGQWNCKSACLAAAGRPRPFDFDSMHHRLYDSVASKQQ